MVSVAFTFNLNLNKRVFSFCDINGSSVYVVTIG